MALDKPIGEITVADLQSLIDDRVPESRTIDYKLALPSSTDDDKREFVADISSFANASGGHLIYGIHETDGVPDNLAGVPGANLDKTRLALENLLRDCIKPRIQGVALCPVPMSADTCALVIRIPQSWNKPHVVEHGKHWRFYSRNSVGKYPLDVLELRSLFLQSGTVAERVRLFRDERLGNIVADQTPAPLNKGARMVLHLVPLSSSELPTTYALTNAIQQPYSVRPIGGDVRHRRNNFDGFLAATDQPPTLCRGYTQVFRNGVVEAVDTRAFLRADSSNRIGSREFESAILEGVEQYLKLQQEIMVPPPVTVMLSFVGVRGYPMAVHRSLDRWNEQVYPIDRDTITCPEVVLDDYPSDRDHIARDLKPAFDAVWNATGWPSSMNYGPDGSWGTGPNLRFA